MSTIANPRALAKLLTRLESLKSDTPRRWGTMTAGEMVCHLADAHKSVMDRHGKRPSPRSRPLMKWIALYAPFHWPRGFKSPARIDQRKEGTRPVDFSTDRQRALETLRGLATAPSEAWPPNHAVFGTLTADEWRRWAFRHTDHHLRQFGL